MLADTKVAAVDSILKTMEPYVGNGQSVVATWTTKDIDELTSEKIRELARQMAINSAAQIDRIIYDLFHGKGE